MNQKDVTLLATADWDNPLWTNKQHVATQLARRGYRVFYIESLGLRFPKARGQDIKRIGHRLRKAFTAPKCVDANIWVWSPIVFPAQKCRFVRMLNRFILTTILHFWLSRLGFRRDILWTYNPLTLNLLSTQGFEKLVYHCVDEIKAQPGMPVSTLEQFEQYLTEMADMVFVTSPNLLQSRSSWNPHTYYFPNVSDYEHFAKACLPDLAIPDEILKIKAPRIGFIGAISSYKVDFSLLEFVAKQRPDCSIILIGKVGEGDPDTDFGILANYENIIHLGVRPYAELPQILKGFDVAILPCMLNEYTCNMFPMKFFEYLAAGKSVVSTFLPALSEFQDLFYMAKSYQDFVHGIELALAGKTADLDKRLSVAKEHTYSARTDKMLQLITKHCYV